MAQWYAISLIFFVISIVESIPPNITSDLVTKVKTFDNITRVSLQEAHRNIQNSPFNNITKLERFVTYTFGKRRFRDHVVGKYTHLDSSLLLRNFKTTITYPGRKDIVGQKISFIDITVFQTSNLGKANIISGGIGQHNVTIELEAYNTKRFDYIMIIYSSASRLQSVNILISFVLVISLTNTIIKF